MSLNSDRAHSSGLPRSVTMAGLSFRPTTRARLLEDLAGWRRGELASPPTIGYVNPHVATTASRHVAVTTHLSACSHVCIDGVGVQLALRLRGISSERLPAHQALDLLLDNALLEGRTIAIGTEPELISSVSSGVSARSDQLLIVGSADGFQSDAELATLLKNHEDADVILIGAGSPRSEMIASLARSMCPRAVIFNVGAGTLKVFAGARRHPPAALSKVGLDWVYRLLVEPHTRPRYLRGFPAFLRLLIRGGEERAS